MTWLKRRLPWLALLIACCAASAVFAWTRGQDVEFDQLNYHIYAAFAFIHGRIDIDAAPAQVIHSYFNPLANLPFYGLFRVFGPAAASVVTGAVQGANLFLVAVIAWTLCRDLGARRRLVCAGLALVVSAASPMALSEIGTSYTDGLTSLLVLGAVALMTRAPLAAGGLVGAAVALKLTNAPFAIGLVAASLPGGAILAGLGAMLGFAFVGGPWCVALWSRFGNPVFPYYNTIFRSPDFPLRSDIDHRYLPSGLLDGLAYPFRWAAGIVPAPEIGFRDIRFAVLLTVLAAVAVIRRRAPPEAAQARLLVFWTVSFAVWLCVFAIQRYILVLELLCGPVALAAGAWIGGRWTRPALAGSLAAAAVATVAVPDWGHAPWMPGMYGLRVPPALMDDGLFFMAGEPVSYVIPSFSREARFFGMMDWDDVAAGADTVITRRIAEAVAGSGERKLRVIASYPLSVGARQRIGSYGLGLAGPCTPIPGYSDTGLMLACALVKTAGTGPAAVSLASGERLDLADPASGFTALTAQDRTGWTLGSVANLAAPGGPGVLVRVAQPGALRLRFEYDGGAFPPVSVNGRDLAAASDGSVASLCAASGPDGLTDIRFLPGPGQPGGSVRLLSLSVEATPQGCGQFSDGGAPRDLQAR